MTRHSHTHRPFRSGTFYTYCSECHAPITCSTSNGLGSTGTWRIDHSTRGALLRDPWDRLALAERESSRDMTAM